MEHPVLINRNRADRKTAGPVGSMHCSALPSSWTVGNCSAAFSLKKYTHLMYKRIKHPYPTDAHHKLTEFLSCSRMSRRSVHVVVELAKWVVVEIESVIGGCKLVGIKRTINRYHLRRLHFFQLTSTSSEAVVNPSNVQQVVMVVVE